VVKRFGLWQEFLAADGAGAGAGDGAPPDAGKDAGAGDDKGDGGDAAAAKIAAAAKAAQDGTADKGGDDGTQGDGTGKDGGPDAGEPKVPDTYTLKVPEGSALKAETLAAEAKTLKLTQPEAEALVKVRTADLEREQAEIDTNLAAVKADKELGGAKFEQTKKVVQSGFTGLMDLARLTKDERAYVERFFAGPAGNHPAFVRMLARIGRALQEDTPPGGKGQGDSTPKTPAEVLYGTH
jgi:hypothetical protein